MEFSCFYLGLAREPGSTFWQLSIIRVKEPCVCAARELLTLARKLEEHRIYPA